MADGNSQSGRTVIDYTPEQREIIAHRRGDLQVVACAGSGKTETVARHIAELLAEGVAPEAILAFTFTNDAAASLKTRVLRKVIEVQPGRDLDTLSPMFVGTIHAWCMRFLQERAPRYATFELFEEHKLAGLALREFNDLGLEVFGRNRTEVVERFLRTVDVVENEMRAPSSLPAGDFRDVYARFLDTLERYHVLTFNQCVARAVLELEREHVRETYHATLRHLIVDEFQDVNPAQARLVDLLGQGPVRVCVVGDDDQAIYQWRGSSVEYIRDFGERRGATVVELGANRRSHAGIVNAAGAFAKRIPQRIDKTISAVRGDHALSVHASVAQTLESEAARIADAIVALRARGFAYRDAAVLLRSVKTSARPILDALEARGVPVRCEGRQSLFMRDDVSLLGDTFAWLAGEDSVWRAGQGAQPLSCDALTSDLAAEFELSCSERSSLRATLGALREGLSQKRDADLLGVFHEVLAALGVARWDLSDARAVTRLGALARFSVLLADFESVHRRAHRVAPTGPERYRGGSHGGTWYLRSLANYLSYYARKHYEEFGGEPDHDVDAVTVTTIHASKGLEWPVVFVPCLAAQRFPTKQSGREGDWLIGREEFPAERYEGSDADERRLFYVAMTRARDHLYLSTFARIKNRAAPSPYLLEVMGAFAVSDDPLPLPAGPVPRAAGEADKPTFSFSELALYRACPQQYRLRQSLGFMPSAAKEMGYGKAVHHILRRVAEHHSELGAAPTTAELDAIVAREFYLPFADRAAFTAMEARAKTLVSTYLRDFRGDLSRVWETERAFELHLDDATVAGRADVILDREGGVTGAMAIVDYKTRAVDGDDTLALQLQVYTAAARGEGIDVQAAYLHDLGGDAKRARMKVDTSKRAVDAARAEMNGLAKRVRLRCFDATPGPQCAGCDVKRLCGSAKG
ncbi:MAG: ATP-dependent DNA helicase [Polyangiales bacterium]